jgi:hypothetical protein
LGAGLGQAVFYRGGKHIQFVDGCGSAEGHRPRRHVALEARERTGLRTNRVADRVITVLDVVDVGIWGTHPRVDGIAYSRLRVPVEEGLQST